MAQYSTSNGKPMVMQVAPQPKQRGSISRRRGPNTRAKRGGPAFASNHRVPDHEATTKFLEDTVGNTPLVKLKRLPGKHTSNEIYAKLEGNNPAGSVKDRPALSMIRGAEQRGEIHPGDRLIEATSGNTGIALAMASAMKGYRMTLIMPENMSEERRASMAAFGAEFINVPPGQMEQGAMALRFFFPSLFLWIAHY